MNSEHEPITKVKDAEKFAKRQKGDRFLMYNFGGKWQKFMSNLGPSFIPFISLPIIINFVSNLSSYSVEEVAGFAAIIAFAAAIALAIYVNLTTKKVFPYENNKESVFPGIYIADQLTPNDFGRINSREKEAKYVAERLVTAAKHGDKKNLLLLTGESGCGKSTITKLLEEKYTDWKNRPVDYPKALFSHAIRFSSGYSNFSTSLVKVINDSGLFKLSNDLKYDQISNYLNKHILLKDTKKPILFIFDQFEQFFNSIADENKRKDILTKFFSKLANPNLCVLFSIRQDNLHQFLYEINFVLPRQELVEGLGDITVFKFGHTVSDKETKLSPNTDLDCEHNSVIMFLNGKNNNIKDLKEKCQKLFDVNGIEKLSNISSIIFDYVKNLKLIEQQFLLSILEYEWIHSRDDSYFDIYAQKNKDGLDILDKVELINRYFDRQLCSTEYFFEALQIMYLISTARKYNIVFAEEEFAYALFCDSADYIHKILQSLENNNLIKQVYKNENIKKHYEIIHDYIAEQFIEYSTKLINSDVKQSLDYFRELKYNSPSRYQEESNSQNDSKPRYPLERARNIAMNRKEADKIGPVIILIQFLIFITSGIINNHIGSTTDDILNLCMALVPCVLGIGYVWALHINAFASHPKKCMRVVSWIFLIIIPTIVVSFIIMFWGFLNNWGYVLLGFSVVFQAFVPLFFSFDKNLSDLSKKFFRGIFCRSFPQSIVVIVATIFILSGYIYNPNPPLSLLCSGIMLFVYFTHLKPIYYARILGMMNNVK